LEVRKGGACSEAPPFCFAGLLLFRFARGLSEIRARRHALGFGRLTAAKLLTGLRGRTFSCRHLIVSPLTQRRRLEAGSKPDLFDLCSCYVAACTIPGKATTIWPSTSASGLSALGSSCPSRRAARSPLSSPRTSSGRAGSSGARSQSRRIRRGEAAHRLSTEYLP
jgi:hypothetical protein